MAKKTKPATAASGNGSAVPAPMSRVTRYVLGSILLALWTLTVLSLISFDPADPPGHAIAPYNEHATNWIGSTGAFIAYHAYLVLGPGVWVLLGAALLYMLSVAMARPITQLVLRVIGVIIMATMLSCLVNLCMPAFGTRPEGSGGLLALFINHELLPRFNTAGTVIILGVSFWVGAIVTFDELVMAIPNLVARYAVKAFNAVPRFKVRMPAFAGQGLAMFQREATEPDEADEPTSVSASSVAEEAVPVAPVASPAPEPTVAMASVNRDLEVVTTSSLDQPSSSPQTAVAEHIASSAPVMPVPLMEEPIASAPMNAQVIDVAHALHPTDPPAQTIEVQSNPEHVIADVAPPIPRPVETPVSTVQSLPQYPPMPQPETAVSPLSRIAMLAMLPSTSNAQVSPIPPQAQEIYPASMRQYPHKFVESTTTSPAPSPSIPVTSPVSVPPSSLPPSPAVESSVSAGGNMELANKIDADAKFSAAEPPIDQDETEAVEDAPAAYLAEKAVLDSQEALRSKVQQLQIHFQPPKPEPLPPAREVDLSGYQFPGFDLLVDPETTFNAEMEKIVRDQALLLESAMQQYRIDGEVVGIDSGPVITLYEIRLAPGTKVNSLSAVASDLARALKAPNVRIVPNMVGKDTVGVEVPNQVKERVRLKELITAYKNGEQKMTMPMFLGKDASGNPLIEDLAKMPHMLIAGTTGSGKSVCMNSIIMSFLLTKRPDELKLVLVDPKMVEMSQFRDIPHLMCPVVTEMNKAAAILEWAVTKMDERYELLVEAGVRDISSYNSLSWEELRERFNPASEAEEAKIPKKLYYMVFVIDELADLMMTNKEVEGFIVRIAQKARAVGMHLILATQRPQANVVTGLIKGNMPCRISMKVASGLDSRIVLDQKGAELLLGHGDMLFLSPRNSKLTRAQGTLVDDFELRRCVKFLKDVAQQSFEPQLVQIRAPGSGGEDSGERDELFDDAVRVVLETKRGSVSLLQRRLTIGYARASRLIEQMAVSGLLGDYKGSQAREVTVTLEEWEAMKAQREADERASAFGKPSSAAAATASAHSHPSDGHDDEASVDDGVPDEMDNEYRN